LVAKIRSEDGYVIWDDFREGSEDRPSSRAVEVGDFHFEIEQYTEELERAHRDRPWESPDRLAARLVGERLRAISRPTAASGWVLEKAWAGITIWHRDSRWLSAGTGPGVSVSLRNLGRQIVVDFPDDRKAPDARANSIVETLLEGDPTAWLVSFKGGNLAEWSSGERDELGPGGAVRRFNG